MLKKILLFLLLVILALVGIVLFNTFTFRSIQTKVEAEPAPDISPFALQHLSQAINFKTVSYNDSSLFDSAQFNSFHRFLREAYPLVHQNMTREVVEGYSLLYKWRGQDTTANPIVLMAHQDVVPIEEASKSLWTVDPFAGVIKDNFIWGRGSADDKINLIAIMEGAEKLLKDGFTPSRTVYLAFGHDEEIGGRGARAIAALLKSRNIRADLVLDEGGIVTREKVPGMTIPVALLGTSEKGYLSMIMSVEKNGGHSSMPEAETSIDILTRAIGRLRENPFQADFSPSTQHFMQALGPEMPFTNKMAFANFWLFKPMVTGIYESSAAGNAMIRTTLAPTIINAGMKDNVVPTVATATINIRMLPGDSSREIIERLKVIIDDDRVKLTPMTAFSAEPSDVTSPDSFAYRKIDTIIKRSFDGVVSTPFLMIGGTDSRHFAEVSDGIIKFSPMIDPIGFHGVDERVSLESFKTSLWFFEQLLKDLK
jgi:carboxypeptidase PM20D1